MIYNADNVRFASVYDVDTSQKIMQVMQIDTDANEMLCAYFPIRVVDDRVDTYTIQYATIYPIFGDSMFPVLFHCYGRKN